MTALERLLDFLSPPLVETEAGQPRIRPVPTCGVTYGYVFVIDDDERPSDRPGGVRPRSP